MAEGLCSAAVGVCLLGVPRRDVWEEDLVLWGGVGVLKSLRIHEQPWSAGWKLSQSVVICVPRRGTQCLRVWAS